MAAVGTASASSSRPGLVRRKEALPPLSVGEQSAYARALEVEPELEPWLFQLVQELLRAPLPPPWRQAADAHRRIYFYNTITRDTTWTHPLFQVHAELIATCRRVLASADRSAAAAAELRALREAGEAELVGWREARAQDGHVYFYNEQTRETRWDDPFGWFNFVLGVQANLLLRLTGESPSSDREELALCEDEAARIIQAAYRRHLARQAQLRELQRAAAVRLQRSYRQCRARRRRRELAALLIQRAFRSWLHGRLLARQWFAAEVIQRAFRRRRAAVVRVQRAFRRRRQRLARAREAAAVRIQRAFRQWRQEALQARRHAAAVRIQRVFRYRRAAAVLLQRAFRSRRRRLLRAAAAARVQRAVRHWLRRRRRAREHAAAVLVQRAFRRRRQRCLRARREAAAVQLQRAVRRWQRRLLSAREHAAAVQRARQEAAAVRIQRACRHWRQRLWEREAAAAARASASSLAAEEAAAVRIQRACRHWRLRLRQREAAAAARASASSPAAEEALATPSRAPLGATSLSLGEGEEQYDEDFESPEPTPANSPTRVQLSKARNAEEQAAEELGEESHEELPGEPLAPRPAEEEEEEEAFQSLPATPAAAGGGEEAFPSSPSAPTSVVSEVEDFHSVPPTPSTAGFAAREQLAKSAVAVEEEEELDSEVDDDDFEEESAEEDSLEAAELCAAKDVADPVGEGAMSEEVEELESTWPLEATVHPRLGRRPAEEEEEEVGERSLGRDELERLRSSMSLDPEAAPGGRRPVTSVPKVGEPGVKAEPRAAAGSARSRSELGEPPSQPRQRSKGQRSEARDVEKGPGKARPGRSVRLLRAPGVELGLEVERTEGELVVLAVREGAAREWNSQNPKKQLRPGDRILEVNGARGSSERLLQELQASHAVQLRVCAPQRPRAIPPEAFAAALVPSRRASASPSAVAAAPSARPPRPRAAGTPGGSPAPGGAAAAAGGEEARRRARRANPAWKDPGPGLVGGALLRRLRRRCRRAASPRAIVHLPALARQVDRAEELKFQLLEQGKRNLYDAYNDIFHEMLGAVQEPGRPKQNGHLPSRPSPGAGSRSTPVLTEPAANMGRRAQVLAALSPSRRAQPQGVAPAGLPSGRTAKAVPGPTALAPAGGRPRCLPRQGPGQGLGAAGLGRAGALSRAGASLVGRSAPVLLPGLSPT